MPYQPKMIPPSHFTHGQLQDAEDDLDTIIRFGQPVLTARIEVQPVNLCTEIQARIKQLREQLAKELEQEGASENLASYWF
jgi:hypothetical protein